MKIDGKPLRGEKGWSLIHRLAQVTVNAEEVDCETFIQSTEGPDCMELTPSFIRLSEDDWPIVIHNHTHIEMTVTFRDEKFRAFHIANKELFKLAAELTPQDIWSAEWN